MPEAEYWTPNFRAPDGRIHKKQVAIYNSYARYLLASGPRRTGKSIGVEHKVIRHLWETQGARAALVTVTNKVGKEGGVWSDLIEIILPEWLQSNMVGITGLPFEYTSENRGIPGPRVDSNTRTSSFRIRNYWGGESELIHLSLDNVAEVESKFKGTRFSLVWFSELSEFNSPNVFTATIQQLRIGDRKNQQFIADTNPSVDGEDSWIYQMWYVQARSKTPPEAFAKQALKEGNDPIQAWEMYRRDFQLIEVFLDDNPFITREERTELMGSNVGMNEGDFDRNVLGVWRKGYGHRGKLFSHLIVESIHFVNGAIDIASDTSTLYCGWDIGQVNNAFVILEKRIVNELVIWNVLDEVVTIDDKISTEQYAVMCMEKMVAIEEFYKRPFEWVHWSDDTATRIYRAASSDGYDAAIVARISEGWINLQAADKPDTSVVSGIGMIGRALRENRLFIGSNCPKIREMLMEVSEGKTKPVDDSVYKHPFDALRYPIYMEARRYMADISIKPKASERTLISV